MARRKKSDLEIQLERSIKLAKAGKLRKPTRDSLGNRLRHADGLDIPDSLADPDEAPRTSLEDEF